MTASVRRARGTLLRAAFDRRLAFGVGALLVGPAVYTLVGDYSWESWLSDGLVSVLGATGVALVVVALSGRRPDWIE